MPDTPAICEVGLEFTILIKEIQYSDGCVGNIHNVVNIYNDNSVFMKEILVKPAGAKETLHSASSHTFSEFSGKFPEDAKVIKEYIKNHNMVVPWVR